MWCFFMILIPPDSEGRCSTPTLLGCSAKQLLDFSKRSSNPSAIPFLLSLIVHKAAKPAVHIWSKPDLKPAGRNGAWMEHMQLQGITPNTKVMIWKLSRKVKKSVPVLLGDKRYA